MIYYNNNLFVIATWFKELIFLYCPNTAIAGSNATCSRMCDHLLYVLLSHKLRRKIEPISHTTN